MNKILLFKLSTCGPCKLLSRLFTQLHILKKDIVLDEDDNADTIADKYHVKSVPTIIVLDKDGNEVGDSIDLSQCDYLLDTIEKNLLANFDSDIEFINNNMIGEYEE